MKRCPQCNRVFEDDKVFCTQDGSSLVNEAFSLPSDFAPEDFDDDEQQTIIRKPQKRIDISKPKVAPQPDLPQIQPEVSQYAPDHNSIPPKTSPQKSGCLKYSIILFVGLLIGSAIALGFVGASYYYLYDKTTGENRNSSVSENNNSKAKSTANDEPTETASGDHSKPNKNANESKLNGQIIKSNAALRSTPDNQAKRLDTLPRKDRIEIIKRKSSSSKWYQIECEHGSKGWIDGYSIKFTN